MSTSAASSSLGNTNGACCAKKYCEFSKPADDFFSKDFPAGVVKFEAKSLSRAAFFPSAFPKDTFSDEFKLTAVKDISTGSISAEIKNTSYLQLLKDKLELKSTATINSANVLNVQFLLSHPAVKGLKADIGVSSLPSGCAGVKLGFEAAKGCIQASSHVDVLNGPLAYGQVSTRVKDFMLGAEVGYDVASGKLEKYTASIALDRPREKVVLQVLTGCQSFNASYFQKINDQLEIAYKAFWSAKSPAMSMEVGAKFNLQGGSFLKTKIDNNGRLGVALANELRPGMLFTLGALVDTNKLQENAHKFGVELNYAA